MITLYHGSNIVQLIDDVTLARELTYKKLNRQYFFGTEKAISKLKKL